MRLHRDTRFSPDKTPYHAHLSGLFWEEIRKRPGVQHYGFHIEATGMALMAGIFKFPPAMLVAYREVVSDESFGAALEEVLEAVCRAGHYDIAGERYQRVPSGYDPSHRRADLLRYNGLSAFAPCLPVSDLLHICSGGSLQHSFSADGTSVSLVGENGHDTIMIHATMLLADSTGAMEAFSVTTGSLPSHVGSDPA